MSAEKNNVEKVSFDAPSMSYDQLFQMLIKVQQQAIESNEKLINAVLESKKPYIDPAVLQAKQDALKEKQRQIQIELRKRQLTKEQCLHQRTNSDGTWDDRGRLNIKWQQHSNGITTGVCGTCGSPFDSRNPKDRDLLMKDGRALRQMGRARSDVAAFRLGQ